LCSRRSCRCWPLCSPCSGLASPPPLLRLSPQQQRQRTQDVLIAWLLEAAERQPILMVWEGLHWADPSTLELLARFTSQVASARVFVVSTFRPGFQHAWDANTHFSQLVLPRLTPLQVEAMLSGILTDQTVPAELIAHVMTATDGVPLFIEELTKRLLETGRLRKTATGYALTGLLPLHAIPVTLYDTLLARLERLTPGAEVARVAASWGENFPPPCCRRWLHWR
jgi:predicted ATPase